MACDSVLAAHRDDRGVKASLITPAGQSGWAASASWCESNVETPSAIRKPDHGAQPAPRSAAHVMSCGSVLGSL